METWTTGPVVVTGASGFIGSRLRSVLLKAGADVVALRRPSSPRASEGRSEEVDYTDADQVAAVLERIGPAYVFHVAGATKGVTYEDFARANVTPTEALVQALQKNGEALKRFVLVSSLAAHGPASTDRPLREEDPSHPLEHYGRSKLAAEQVVQATGLPYTILCPGGVYGPGDVDYFQAFKMAERGWIIYFGNRAREWSAVYVDDMVDVCLTAATNEAARGRRYFISDGEPVTWESFFGVLAKHASRRVRQLDLPEMFVDWAAFGGELITGIDKRPRLLNRQKAIMGRQPAWTCTPARAMKELSWAPRVPLEEGVKRSFAWYRKKEWL